MFWLKASALRGSVQQVPINPLRDEQVPVDRTVTELQLQYSRLGIMTSRPQCCRLHKRALHRYLQMEEKRWRDHDCYGERAVSSREYCSRSMRLSFSRNLPRTGSAMSSRILPNSASVSRQNRCR